jgi:predicted dehydrogenase
MAVNRKPLRVGIAGCGMVAQNWHIPAFAAEKRIIIAAVCDLNDELASSIAAKYKINHWYSDVPEMLGKEQLDILDICLPHSQHAAVAIQGIEAGCHILVEKPIAGNCAEAEAMINASKRHGRKVCVIHNRLFHPVVMKAVSMEENGRLGKFISLDIRDALRYDHPKLIDANHWCHKLPAGIFSEFLPHSLYIARKFIGNFQQIEVFLKKMRPESWLKADEARILIAGERGMANITASCNSPKNANTLDIFGTARQLHVDVYNGLLISEGTGGESRALRALGNLSKAYQYAMGTASTAMNALLGKYSVGHSVLVKQFVQSIINDTASPVPPEEAIELLKNLERVENEIKKAISALS